jgi:tetratricopeptide (TPR) repeat protein
MLQGLKKIAFIAFSFLVYSSIVAQETSILDQANAFFQKGQYKDVIGLLAGEEDKYPNQIQYYSLLGQSYFYLENDGEAQRLLKKAIELDPNDLACHYYLAGSFFYTNQYESAVLEYEICIKLDPKDPRPYYMLSCVAKNDGWIEDQQKLLESAMSLDTKNVKYIAELANCYFEQKKYDKAKVQYLICYKNDPKNYVTVSSLMQIEFQEGNSEKFQKYKKELIKIKLASKDDKIQKLKHFKFDEYQEGDYTIQVCEIFKEEGDYYYFWIFYIYDEDDTCLGSVNLESSIAMDLAGLKYIIGVDKYTEKGHKHKTTNIAFAALPEYGQMKKYVAEELTTGLAADVMGTYED